MAIYLFCRHHRSLKRIFDRFPSVTLYRIEPFLKMMVGKKLMFGENDNYLSLAVPASLQLSTSTPNTPNQNVKLFSSEPLGLLSTGSSYIFLAWLTG